MSRLTLLLVAVYRAGGETLGSFSYGLDWSIYELVHELHFEQGHLVEAIDLSAEAAQRRSPTVWD